MTNTVSRRGFAALLAGGAALAYAAGPALAVGETPIKGGTLRLMMGHEPSLQVEILQSAGGAGVGARVIEGLLTEDTENRQQPLLAKSWTVSEDGLAYTFELRDDARWHDGTPFTSADVAFSYTLLKEIHPRRRATFANLDRIDDSDPHRVVLHFTKPAPFLLPALNANSAPIVPKHLYEGTDPRSNPHNAAPIGTGPYKFVEWQRGSHTLLERNPDYRDPDLPRFDTVLIRYVPDSISRLTALEANEVDIGFSSPVPLAALAQLKADPQFDIQTRGNDLSGALNQIFFNLRFEPFKDLRVRQAVAHAIDIDAFIQTVWLGYAVPSPTIIPPTNRAFHDDTIKAPAFDPALAEQLLDEAGYKRGPDGTRFAIRFTANPFMSQVIDGANFVRSALAKIGIKANIELFDHPTYIKKLYTEAAFDLDIQVLAAGYDPTDGIVRGYHSRNIKEGLAWSNHSTYANPEVDALFDEASSENDPARRRDLYVRIQRIIAADLPSVNLVAYQSVTVARRSLQDYFVDQQGGSSHFARAWSQETA